MQGSREQRYVKQAALHPGSVPPFGSRGCCRVYDGFRPSMGGSQSSIALATSPSVVGPGKCLLSKVCFISGSVFRMHPQRPATAYTVMRLLRTICLFAHISPPLHVVWETILNRLLRRENHPVVHCVWTLWRGDFTAYHPGSSGSLWGRTGTAGCTVIGAWRAIYTTAARWPKPYSVILNEGLHIVHRRLLLVY
jgi:hypothetical protein